MIFEKTEILYKNNINIFQQFEKMLNNTFGLTTDISSRTIKRILVQNIAKRSKIDIFNKILIYVSFLLIIPIFFYLIILLLISKKKVNKTENYDIVFDCWGNNEKHNQLIFERFYHQINDLLIDKKRAIFEPNIIKRDDYTILSLYNIDFIKPNYNMINKNIIIRILKYYTKNIFIIIFLCLKSNINFILIFIKILRQYILHQRNSQNINNIKYLISAGDNYYTPLMYHIYKKNGIENIYLLQNGFRTEEFDSSFYISCDNYFSLNIYMIDDYLGLKAYNNIINICSLRLYDATCHLDKTKPFYDIVFIETIASDSILNDKEHSLHNLMTNYLTSLKLISEFSNKNKQHKIIYRIKRKGYEPNSSKFYEIRDKLINSSNIILDDEIHSNSYEAILDSKVVVYSHSTMGYESLLLGKNVLCCNFDNFDFLLSQNDEIGVIIEDNYNIFENKLFELLENSNTVKQYFKDKRSMLGDLAEDPYKKILDAMKLH